MDDKKKPYKLDANKAKETKDDTAKILNTYRKSDHAADPYLMDWTSQNLPSRKFYFITDVDLIIRDIRGKVENLMLIEVKRYKANVKGCQKSTFSILHQLIKAGIKEKRGRVRCKAGYNHRLKYHGLQLLQFEKETFEDGLVYWNGHIVTEEQLIKLLSFE